MRSLCQQQHGVAPVLGVDALRVACQPPQAGVGRVLANQQAQVAQRLLKLADHALPISQALGQLQTASKDVSGQIEHLSQAQLLTQKLYAGFIELMGFIEHHHPDTGQQLGHAALAHGQIRKKQMVVDHHHISRHGLFAGGIHMALFPKTAG